VTKKLYQSNEENFMDRRRLESLIKVLKDPKADIAEQDDAARDLGDFNEDEALQALVEKAKNPETDDYLVLETCGESISEIWLRRNFFSTETYDSLRRLARVAIYRDIQHAKPEWLAKFNIEDPGPTVL
jgi:hypothetical protein